MQLRLNSQKIWLATAPIDFRKSIDGLSEIIASQWMKNPTQGIYVLYNKPRDKLKILAWHGNGFIILCKRIEQGRFTFPSMNEGVMTLSKKHLSWLLAGLSLGLPGTIGLLILRFHGRQRMPLLFYGSMHHIFIELAHALCNK